MNGKQKLLALAMAVSILTLGLAQPADAAAVVAQRGASPAVIVHPDGPSGCPSGDFCAWTSTNGNGTICRFTQKSYSSWTSTACYHEMASIFNNVPSGANQVWLYFGTSYSDAYAILSTGDYYLDLSKNKFNHGSGAGLGKPMENNINSLSWH